MNVEIDLPERVIPRRNFEFLGEIAPLCDTEVVSSRTGDSVFFQRPTRRSWRTKIL